MVLLNLRSNDLRNICTLVFIHLFNATYGPGEGPIPFVSSTLAGIAPEKMVSDNLSRYTLQKACRCTIAISVGFTVFRHLEHVEDNTFKMLWLNDNKQGWDSGREYSGA